MQKISIGKDKDNEIFKLQYGPDELPSQQLFNKDDVIIGNPMSNVAIGFIYTWKEDDAPMELKEFFLRVSNYAFLTGFWKTTNGSKYVFANILTNPNINKLVLFVYKANDNGHLLVDALTKFWQDGVDEKGVVIGSHAPNPRFEQVPLDALERIRNQCDLIVVRNMKDFSLAEDVVKSCIQEPDNAKDVPRGIEFYSMSKDRIYDDGARFEEPMKVDLAGSSKKVEYIEKYSDLPLGHSVHADNLADALEMVTAHIYEHGTMFKDQRGVITMESRSFSVTIKDVLAVIPDNFSEEYIKKYVDEFMAGKGEGLDEFAYTYHERIFRKWGDQVQKAVDLLKKSNNTRRCMITLWDPETDLENSNPPCLNFIWLVIRDKLEMHVVYRSHHLSTITQNGRLLNGEGAFVPNLYALGTLHKKIADDVGVERGPIILTDFSGHLYMSEVE